MSITWDMDIEEKLKILADAAKYDVSCVSSGVDRKNDKKVWEIPWPAVYATALQEMAGVYRF